MKKILWLAPNLNHYKSRLLNKLALADDIKLTVISGTGRNNMGDKELLGKFSFDHVKLNVSKSNFGTSKEVLALLKKQFKSYDWIA